MTSNMYHPKQNAFQQGVDIYRDAMRDFIVRCMRKKRGVSLKEGIRSSLVDRQLPHFDESLRNNGNDVKSAIDTGFIPLIVGRNWNDVFQHEFKNARTVRSNISVITQNRNDLLGHAPDGDDADVAKVETGLQLISEVMASINRPDLDDEVLAIRNKLRDDIPSAPPAAVVTEATSKQPVPKSSNGNGARPRPWRDVIRPNDDVEDGSFQQSEFAADLQQVQTGSAPAVYGDPAMFFSRTYITPGIHDLLVNIIKRLSGNSGVPVIQTKTGFGGGKTHSLIAIYHLVENIDSLLSQTMQYNNRRAYEDIHKILNLAGIDADSPVRAKTAVLSGSVLSHTTDRATDTGDPLNTLWAEMAWQLGKDEAYGFVCNAAIEGVAPGGEELDRLFEHVGPCVILMDEIVNYARNAPERRIDHIFTFIQNLTESVRRSSNVALVVTLPSSASEAGAQTGQESLQRVERILNSLDNIMGRVETVWQPLEIDEAFEVVRRRLFRDEFDEQAREATCRAFHRIYQQSSSQYPAHARETRYLDRLRECYPIHPEIFDRLYQDWSLHHDFQRTRGVLRLMAQSISSLCADGDQSPLIMPGSLPFNDVEVSNEFVRLLGSQWNAVMDEVDRDNSRTHEIDKKQPARFGKVGGAARRIARAVFLGSSTEGALRGIDAQQINLAVVKPGDGASLYAEALREMDGELYHFYRSDNRYYFDAQENLNKVVNDRAAELSGDEVDNEIVKRLNGFRTSAKNRAVEIYSGRESYVQDADFVRLVILGPEYTRPSRSQENDLAKAETDDLLLNCDRDTRRMHPNTLLFLAASIDRIRDLRSVARQYLAWQSLLDGDRRLNLDDDHDRRLLAETNRNKASEAVQTGIEKAYRWIMSPSQPDPQQAVFDTSNWKQITESPDIADSALKRFVSDEQLVDDRLAPNALKRVLDSHIWKSPSDRYHISVNELWDMLARYVYMRLRLRNRQVLDDCIAQGIADGVFTCFSQHDADTDKYHGHVASDEVVTQLPGSTQPPGSTLILNPEIAEIALSEFREAAAQIATAVDNPPVEPEYNPGVSVANSASHAPPRLIQDAPSPDYTPRKQVNFIAFHKKVQYDPAYDFNTIRDEIARALSVAGGKVTLDIIVTGSKEDGFDENVARAIKENSDHFKAQHLESEDPWDVYDSREYFPPKGGRGEE